MISKMTTFPRGLKITLKNKWKLPQAAHLDVPSPKSTKNTSARNRLNASGSFKPSGGVRRERRGSSAIPQPGPSLPASSSLVLTGLSRKRIKTSLQRPILSRQTGCHNNRMFLPLGKRIVSSTNQSGNSRNMVLNPWLKMLQCWCFKEKWTVSITFLWLKNLPKKEKC